MGTKVKTWFQEQDHSSELSSENLHSQELASSTVLGIYNVIN